MSSVGERPTTGSSSGGAAAPVNLTQVNGTAVSAANPVPEYPVINGAAVSNANPLPVSGAVAPLSTSLDWFYAGATGGITGTSDVVLAAAAGANLYNTCSSLQFLNTSATGTEIVIKDGSTIIWRGYAPPTIALVTQLQMVPINFSPPLRSSANAALNFACLTTATATRISAQGSVVG